MNSTVDFHIKYVCKKHVCPFCNFRTHKKYNLDTHKRNKHKDKILDQGHTSKHDFPHGQVSNNLQAQVQYQQLWNEEQVQGGHDHPFDQEHQNL
jgi:hypothetical protein